MQQEEEARQRKEKEAKEKAEQELEEKNKPPPLQVFHGPPSLQG